MNKFGRPIEEAAKVQLSKNRVVFERKDLDELNTKEEIYQALSRWLREAYGGTQTVLISLTLEVGKRAITAWKVQIGQVVDPTVCSAAK